MTAPTELSYLIPSGDALALVLATSGTKLVLRTR